MLCRLIRTEGSDFFWKQEDECDQVYISLRLRSGLLTNTNDLSGLNQSSNESDAEFDYEENKKMILSGVKKINLERCIPAQSW